MTRHICTLVAGDDESRELLDGEDQVVISIFNAYIDETRIRLDAKTNASEIPEPLLVGELDETTYGHRVEFDTEAFKDGEVTFDLYADDEGDGVDDLISHPQTA